VTLARRALCAVATAGLLLTTAACGSGPSTGDESPQGGGPSSTSSSSGSELTGSVTVFAAASLKQTFTEIGAEFEKAHPRVEVTFNFAGSSDLVAQLQQGAPADVFASADTKNMEKLGAEAVAPKAFATNTLEIAVPNGNPAHVQGLADLARQDVQLVTCAPEVPCGAAAATVETNAELDWKPVSEEQSVADVLGKVESGEADAGLVYVTDVEAAGDRVVGIEIPATVNAVNTYPIAAVKGSKHGDLAAAWVRLVTGADGQKALAAAGFGQG
jgi:molybdate transport system substrate-binding protein